MPPNFAAAAPQSPDALARAYQTQLGGVAKRAETILEELQAGLGVQAHLSAAEYELLGLVDALGRPARAAFTRTAQHAKKEVSRILGVRLPAEGIQDLRDTFAARQVLLVERAVRDQLALLRAAAENPRLLQTRAAELKTLRNRIRQIASNEIHKLHEAEVEHWATLSGSPGFWYLTARDEKVRPTHAQHHAKYFLWVDRPSQMGEPECRCKASLAAVS